MKTLYDRCIRNDTTRVGKHKDTIWFGKNRYRNKDCFTCGRRIEDEEKAAFLHLTADKHSRSAFIRGRAWMFCVECLKQPLKAFFLMFELERHINHKP